MGGGGAALPLELSKLATLAGHTDAVRALLMPGRLLGVLCSIRLWDQDKHSLILGMTMPIAMPQRENTAIHALAHTPDPAATGKEAETLWSGHWGGSINLWDAAAGSLLRNLSKAHDGCVWAMQPLPLAPELMASTGADGAIRLWDARQAGLVGELTTGCPTYCLAATPGSQPVLVSAGHDGHLRLWDVRGTRTIATLQSHRAPVRSLLVHNGGLWSGSTDGTVRNWEIGRYVGSGAIASGSKRTRPRGVHRDGRPAVWCRRTLNDLAVSLRGRVSLLTAVHATNDRALREIRLSICFAALCLL